MKIKICGLTDPRETIFLNEAGADYAGFVFYEKASGILRLHRQR